MIMTGWPPSRRSRCSSVLSSGFPIVASPNRCQSREQSLQPRWQSKQWLLTFWPVCREGPPTESWKQAPRIAAVESVASSCFLMSWHPPPEPVDKIKRKSHCNKNAIKLMQIPKDKLRYTITFINVMVPCLEITKSNALWILLSSN